MGSPGAGNGENVMNLTIECKQLIDGYIDEVCTNLPRKKRTDIAVEIRSLILDALEDRTQDNDLDEMLVLDVLRELGSPVEMAFSYYPHNYVIGPRMYAPFWLTVRGALIITGIIFLAGTLLGLYRATQSPLTILEILGNLLANFSTSALQTFAVIVLVFMVLERTIPDQDWTLQLKAWGTMARIPFFRNIFGRTTAAGTWDPTVLVTTPKSERVKRGEEIFGMAVLILLAILFNFFPHKVGSFGIISDSGSWFTPLLAPTFGIYLPWWNLYWLLALGLSFVLLARGRWSNLLRWVELGMMVFSGILVYWMVIGPPVIGLTPEYLTLNNTSISAIRLAEETLIPILTTVFKVGLVLHLIFKVLQIFVKLIRLLGKPPILVWKPLDSHNKDQQ
jgi:hypothetical protein